MRARFAPGERYESLGGVLPDDQQAHSGLKHTPSDAPSSCEGSQNGAARAARRSLDRAVAAFFAITRSHTPKMIMSSPSAWWAGDSHASEGDDDLADADDDEAAGIVPDQIACAQAAADACADACAAVDAQPATGSFTKQRKRDYKDELERVLESFQKQLEFRRPRRSLDETRTCAQDPKDRDIVYSKQAVRQLRRLSANGTADTKIRSACKWPAF